MLLISCVFMLLRLFIAALWSPAGKVLASWLLFVMFNCFVTFPCGILGQLWYLVVSIPDLCRLSYFLTMSQCVFDEEAHVYQIQLMNPFFA